MVSSTGCEAPTACISANRPSLQAAKTSISSPHSPNPPPRGRKGGILQRTSTVRVRLNLCEKLFLLTPRCPQAPDLEKKHISQVGLPHHFFPGSSCPISSNKAISLNMQCKLSGYMIREVCQCRKRLGAGCWPSLNHTAP